MHWLGSTICSRVTKKRKVLVVGLFLVDEMWQTGLKGLNLNFLLKGVWAESGQRVCLWFLSGGFEEWSSKARRSCHEYGHRLASAAARSNFDQLSPVRTDEKRRIDEQILDISRSHALRTHSQNKRISPQIVILGHTYQI